MQTIELGFEVWLVAQRWACMPFLVALGKRRLNKSDSLAMFAAMYRASSFVSVPVPIAGRAGLIGWSSTCHVATEGRRACRMAICRRARSDGAVLAVPPRRAHHGVGSPPVNTSTLRHGSASRPLWKMASHLLRSVSVARRNSEIASLAIGASLGQKARREASGD
jgi:hypothetical protein